jgi:long-chain acyl-CoA synthetase
MDVDLELYRQDVVVSRQPPVSLSVIDLAPERPLNTIVMLHGFGGNANQWKYQLKALSDNNRCIAIDLRGHGRSSKPSSHYTIDEMVEDIAGVLRECNVTAPVVLMGHSFGGALATTFAYRYPNLVSKLVLAATTGKFDLPFYTAALLRMPAAVLNLVRPFFGRTISSTPTVLKRYYENSMKRWVGWDMMRRLDVPTLVIRGDRDFLFSQADFDQVARIIPHAEEVNVGVSAHMVMLERRDAVQRAIERFIGTGSDSWRSKEQDAERARLLAERPWVKAYDEGVPPTVSVPRRALHLLLSSTARRYASRPATIFMGRTLTYRQIERQANRLANALRGMGVDKGTRVMILMPNVPQWVIAFYGVLKAGAVVVSASPISPTEEIVREVNDSKSTVLITLTKLAPMARAVLEKTKLEHVIYTNVKDYLWWWQKLIFGLWRESKEGHAAPTPLRAKERLWVDLMKGYRPNPVDLPVAPESLALIQYTGGTTDNPKGVLLSHHALLANAIQTRHWLARFDEGKERMLCVVPFAHVYGLTGAMNTAVAMGAAMIVLPTFVTKEVLQVIKRHKPSLFPGVPTMYVAINNYPGVRQYNIRSVKACISGAAPLPVEVQEAFEKLTKGRLVEGYGLTEAGPVTHGNPLVGARKIGSIGVPFPSTDARIVDLTSGEPVAAGEIGELVVRGPQIMDGYLNNEDATKEALRDGWLFTGDVARMDADGYFQIVSRKKEMWFPERTGKEPYPAFPRDVEEVIYELPEIKETAVVGVAGVAIAFVTTAKHIDASTVTAYCARRLPKELVPIAVVFVDDLPKSFVGKIIRRHLLEKIPETQRKELNIISDRIDEMLKYPFKEE